MARVNRRVKQSPKLNLVSLMDIFTILVFFLMVNSGDVQVLQSSKTIKLPESIAEKRPEETLLVSISGSDIVVQGRKVASVSDVIADKSDEIAALRAELQYQRGKRPELTERENQLGLAVTIMGDHTVPYNLLKKVMATCAQTDYRDISLAVTKVVSSAIASNASLES